jgi:DNA excision repair protein ERCC-4
MITIDRREVQEHPEIPELIELPFTIDTLSAGDYAFLDRNDEPLGIERSEIGNLIQKLVSGELEDQLSRCQDSYSTIILLPEGVYDKVDSLLATHKPSNRGYFRVRVYPHTRYDYIKALEVRLSELGIEVIHSPNFDCSMTVIRTIYQQRTKPEEAHNLFKKIRPVRIPVKLSSNPAVPKLMTLCPRLPERVSIRLINKFGSIWNILHVDDSELLGVEGFGKGLLTKLKKEVGKDG